MWLTNMPNNSKKTIRIVGASSAIAQDFLRVSSKVGSQHVFHLYSRDFSFLPALKINNLTIFTHKFSDLEIAEECDAVLNFVGLGSPSRVALESSRLEPLDLKVDLACMRLLELKPEATYLYMSSGASYGSNFSTPAVDANELPEISKFDLPREMYGWIKRSAEVRHRSLPQYKIINLRIFGYASRNMDLNAGFLLSDLAKSLVTGVPARISSEITHRDFINPDFFYEVVNYCLENNLPNTSLDLVSTSPLGKHELVAALEGIFGLKVVWDETPSKSNSISKSNYFSQSTRLRESGVGINKSALEMVIDEFQAIANRPPG